MPRRLQPDDQLYRVLEPEWWDDNGPQPVGFQDPGKLYESLSFWVAGIVTPSHAMSELAKWSRAKKLCKTKPRDPTPGEMYARGYRVSRTPGQFILKMIAETAGKDRDRRVEIKQEGDSDVRSDGHLNLRNGKYYAQLLAENSEILRLEETFPVHLSEPS